jgi:hypothetical protein
MPRYLIERTFPSGLQMTLDDDGDHTYRAVIEGNTPRGVVWIHSYVTPDRSRTYCVYDGPSPEAIRLAAEVNGLPIDRIIEVRVLDPHFHH